MKATKIFIALSLFAVVGLTSCRDKRGGGPDLLP